MEREREREREESKISKYELCACEETSDILY